MTHTPLAAQSPGLSPGRLSRLMRERVRLLELDLTGRHVVTEAATGAYQVTPILAALAGAASVIAVTSSSAYGSVEDVRAGTLRLADEAGVSGRIEVVDALTPHHLRRADVVTNSGHVRPLDSDLIGELKQEAVIPLMYEAWELAARATDVDLEAVVRKGIAVAGTNERHPDIDVFSYLGVMAVAGLHDAGVAVYGSKVAVVSDNDFAEYIVAGLVACGAVTSLATAWDQVEADGVDAVVHAMTPGKPSVQTGQVVEELGQRSPGAVLLQFWGDLDREAAEAAKLPVWPSRTPTAGHMGVLPSLIGPEPIIRLQAGGLKVAQVLLTPAHERSVRDAEYLDAL